MADGVIAGLFLSEKSLSAIAIVLPIGMFATFISGLIVIGTSNLYLREIGKMNKKHADELYGQALLISALVSVALLLLFNCFIDDYFNFMGISQIIIQEAYEYCKYYKYMLFILPFEYLYELLVYDDGDNFISVFASITYLLTNILLPIIFVGRMGVCGIGFGHFLSILIMIFVYLIHLLRKSNNLHFRFYFSLKEIKIIIPLSIVDCIYIVSKCNKSYTK